MSTGTVDQIENEIRVWSFQNFGNGIALGVSRFMGKLLFAVLIFLIGRYCIRKLIAFLPTSRICEKINPTVRPFAIKTIRFVLYFFLGIIERNKISSCAKEQYIYTAILQRKNVDERTPER